MPQSLSLRATSASSSISVPSLQSPSPSKDQSRTKDEPLGSGAGTSKAGEGEGEGEGRGEVGQGANGERIQVKIPANGLLVPTDRSREELEEKWLYHLGRFRIHSEVVLPGYSLYSLRSWYVSFSHPRSLTYVLNSYNEG